MNKTTRNILCALLALALAVLFALPGFAAEKTLVIDDIGKITENGLNELNSRAREISQTHGMDIAFFLLSGDPAQALDEYVRERYLNAQKLGPDGFVLVHDIDGKVWDVICFGKAERLVSDEDMDQLWAAYNAEETYYGGVMAYLEEAEEYLESERFAENAEYDASGNVLRDPETLSLLMDEAGLLNAEAAAALLGQLEVLSAQWRSDVVIVTVDTIGYKTPKVYADDYFDHNGYGQGEDRDGLLLLVSMAERDYYISTSGDSINTFTDAGIAFLGKQLTSGGLSGGDYAEAFQGFADWCDRFFERAAQGKPYDTGSLPKTSSDVVTVIIVSFCGGLIIAAIAVGVMKSQLKTVRKKNQAADYVRPGSLQVTKAHDQFLFKNVTRVYVAPSSSSSGSGGSSTHTSSSGRSHGGGGGKF